MRLGDLRKGGPRELGTQLIGGDANRLRGGV